MELLDMLERFAVPAITAIAGYIIGKPKEKAEIETTNVDNAGKIIDKWEGYASRLEKNIDQLKDIIDELDEALENANQERLACAETLIKLQVEHENLSKLYNELQLELKIVKNEKINFDNDSFSSN